VNVQVELGNGNGPGAKFYSIAKLRFAAATGSVQWDDAMPFARATRTDTVGGNVDLTVAADAIESSGGCGCDPICDLSFSGHNSTTTNESVTVGTLLFPSDGTYTIQWTMTGREIATNKVISAAVVSTYKVIGAVATKVSETLLTDVDEPTGFGAPISNALAGGAAFEITGKLNSPAAWVVGGCAQMNGGQIPPP
jgi:hypothetical protein